MTTVWLFIKSFLGGVSITTYLIIGAVLGFATWSAYVYGAGKATANAKWEVAQLEAKIAKLELEARVGKWAEEAEDLLAAQLDLENEQLQKEVDAYANELKNRPDKCLLGPDADFLNRMQ